MRLFLAVELPAEVRAAVAITGSRRLGWPAATWVRADQLHLTLAFIGEAGAAVLPHLEAALRLPLAMRSRWRATLGGAGAFPSQGPLRVVWAGVEPEPPLADLAAAVRRGCGAAGAAFDERPFAAHLTLARCRPPWPAALRDRLDGLSPPPAMTFEVDGVALIESELGPAGPRHERRAVFPLGAAA